MIDMYEQCIGFLNKSGMIHRYVPLSIVQKAKVDIDTLKLAYRGLKAESIKAADSEAEE